MRDPNNAPEPMYLAVANVNGSTAVVFCNLSQQQYTFGKVLRFYEVNLNNSALCNIYTHAF